MELALYKALRSLNIEEALVDSAINAMEAHFEDRVTRATVPVVAEMRNLGSRMDAIGFKLDAYAQINAEKATNRRWIVGTVIGVVALVPSIAASTFGILKAVGWL